MKRVKMLRTVEHPAALIGDATYVLDDGVADALISDGSAELIGIVAAKSAESAPPAEGAKTKRKKK